MLKAVTFTAPAHWASALVNGDWSGLSDREVGELHAYLQTNPKAVTVCSADDEHLARFEFPNRGTAFCELMTYTYLEVAA